MWHVKILSGTSPGVNCELSEIPSCQNMAQGYFMVVIAARTNRDSCVAGAKIFDSISILLMRRFRYQEINLVLQTGKELGMAPWGQDVIVSKQLPSTNVRQQPESVSSLDVNCRSWLFIDHFIAVFGIEIGFENFGEKVYDWLKKINCLLIQFFNWKLCGAYILRNAAIFLQT